MIVERDITIAELAGLVEGKPLGDERKIVRGVQLPSGQRRDYVAVAWQKEDFHLVGEDVPVVVPEGWLTEGRTGIEVKDPQLAFAKILSFFSPKKDFSPGIHETAVVDAAAKVDPSASVGPYCVIKKDAEIGPGVVLESGVYVGESVKIGARTRIEHGVVLYDGTIVGEDCLIHAGSVIGCDGFGFLLNRAPKPIKIPQLGRVRIGNRVEIGACSTIDRATLDETVVGDDTVIDNHVHIGHNAKIGKGCVLVAMVGIAGSAVLEDGVVMAARSGVADHVRVGKGAVIAAHGGATKDVPPGKVYSGFPAREHDQEMKRQVIVGKLVELYPKLRKVLKSLDKEHEGAGESK
ncbi:MAG: UDP-3-O-[3-hydroxymyristoyl] glucosamine N-acyltransferase [Thermovirga sp.]|nr:MAG: UDP-3-O-(3-hydroxymyristoyl) glucosamine N-acyltransferase [Thermovirga lienii]MDN5368089.1 UDP-3-O-[3-hydroxymyristoyl] glucosamine N-acyltransferase [Thermovirga sp.]